jgi:IS30 family transposase
LVLSKEKPIPYQPPLPPNEAPSGVDAAAGVTPVGLRPPFVTPAAAHSHPDCRGIPILIVAPHRPVLSRTVSIKLRQQWSPEQIAGWLKRAYPGELQNQVSHETIYRSLFIQARGVLKKELLEHLRAKRTIRRSKHASLKRNGLGQIKNAVSISERPASVEDRAVPGHWEGDLIGGSRNSYVATLVERHSRYVMLVSRTRILKASSRR